ncbi:hypothetical protein [Xanthomonas albilineans]|uniref:Hypothetical secreted protein n=1 Tax=Xanthomonas albilineans (strain GPE PC73 / CFBP 7063) TaxID=380358 RepID=D2U8X5_XANAP|nr:hypothetical protein [Xanthomonas albilineans]QHQ28797.1 putative secreted protein [Xanthomonas albilineans]CBA16553.1 hypothetical secreted protein [Xanthomonas albilineans GPE PC73]
MKLAIVCNVFLTVAVALQATTVLAQQAQNCPQLPPQASLQWNERSDKGLIVCRAATADGRQVLGIMLTAHDPHIPLSRTLREEKGSIGGEMVQWYRPDVGGAEIPGLASRRIAIIELKKGQFAQVWIDAGDAQELQKLQGLVQALDMHQASLALEH